MADRILGATRCAHCRAAAAERTCPSCAASVCPACAADWTTCSEPVGRELRLGVGRRLVRVGFDGRLALTGGPVRRERWIDLRKLTWADPERPPVAWPGRERLLDPAPAPEGRWLLRRERWVGQGNSGGWRPDGYDLVDHAGALVAHWPDAPSCQAATVAPSGRAAWAMGSEQQLLLLTLVKPYRCVTSTDVMPGQLVQSADVDLDAKCAVVASWGVLELLRLEGEAWVPAGTVRFDGGDTAWVGLGTGRVAAVVDRRRVDTVLAWGVDATGAPTAEIFSVDFPDGLRRVGALSPDGRYVAVATIDHRVLLMDVDARTTTELEGHTDDVCYIGFVDGGRQLVTADCDNRVIIRPRTSSGYATLVRLAMVE